MKSKKSQNEKFTCEWCKKSFVKETTLLAHSCEPFRRWNNRDTISFRIAHNAWRTMWKVLGNKGDQGIHEFIKNRHYSAFVKFGEWCINEQVQEPDRYIQWNINNKIPLKKWTDLSVYNTYIITLLTTETPESGLNRSLKSIQKWSDDTGEDWHHFFEKVNVHIGLNWIIQGKISPWMLYNCDSAISFLEKCNQEQLNLIQKIAPITSWKIKILRYKSDCEHIKSVLKEAGM